MEDNIIEEILDNDNPIEQPVEVVTNEVPVVEETPVVEEAPLVEEAPVVEEIPVIEVPVVEVPKIKNTVKTSGPRKWL
jgi:hypothetical protein